MQQLVQHQRTGRLSVEQVPRPTPQRGEVLVRTACSLISAGTERMSIALARRPLLGKARERPDLVRKMLHKAKADGLVAALRAARHRLDDWAPLGYSCAGQVIAVAEGADGLQVGDSVACAGAGYASHAELVAVPKHLVARTPQGVSPEEAAFVTLGAIAMQGIRQAGVAVGERVAVVGLGLIGQLTCQLVAAAGASAFAIDIDPHKAELARTLGAADVAARRTTNIARWTEKHTDGAGFDAVIITAATRSSDPVKLAGEIARDRATVVAVGAVGMNVPRRTYYRKELTFKLSRSYGPGRYDATYEGKGIDYPIGYVRWTEHRNMAAFLELIAAGKVDVRPLITHRFALEQALDAYELITGERAEPYLGILLTYNAPAQPSASGAARSTDGNARPSVLIAGAASLDRSPGIGVIGAGRFARGVLLPALAKAGACSLRGISSARGLSARRAGGQFGFAYCTSDAAGILADDATDAVIIATPHNLHARMVCDALTAGKHVFVEKPLCLDQEELDEIGGCLRAHPDRVLMVGFNRRFAPLTAWLTEQLGDAGPLVMNYRVLAGPPPSDHWAGDRATGGGRMIGEACHFVDWMIRICRFLPTAVAARPIPNGSDGAVVAIDFQNGSVGTLTYLASEIPGLAKERIEVLADGCAAEIDNWRRARLWRQGQRTRRRKHLVQRKGHAEELRAFLLAIREGKSPPIPFAEIDAATRATFAIEESLHTGQKVTLAPWPLSVETSP